MIVHVRVVVVSFVHCRVQPLKQRGQAASFKPSFRLLEAQPASNACTGGLGACVCALPKHMPTHTRIHRGPNPKRAAKSGKPISNFDPIDGDLPGLVHSKSRRI